MSQIDWFTHSADDVGRIGFVYESDGWEQLDE